MVGELVKKPEHERELHLIGHNALRREDADGLQRRHTL